MGVRTEACSTGKTNQTGQEQRQLDSSHGLGLSPQEALRWPPLHPSHHVSEEAENSLLKYACNSSTWEVERGRKIVSSRSAWAT